MKQYLGLLDDILQNGFERTDRTGVGTIGVFGRMLRFSMEDGFPLLTTKKLHLKSIIHELLWFLQGGTNIKYLNDNGVTIWNEWANEKGDLGPIYGAQWRNWEKPVWNEIARRVEIDTIDQIAKLIETLRTNPDNRRMLVSAWNVADLDTMLVPPCHYGFQVSTELQPDYRRKIHLIWNQRSVDTFLGLPFNIASYALLLLMIAQVVDMVPGDLICSLGDTHIYRNHYDQVKLQLTREPFKLPHMELTAGHTDMDHWKYEDFFLMDYQAHPHIKGDIAI